MVAFVDFLWYDLFFCVFCGMICGHICVLLRYDLWYFWRFLLYDLWLRLCFLWYDLWFLSYDLWSRLCFLWCDLSFLLYDLWPRLCFSWCDLCFLCHDLWSRAEDNHKSSHKKQMHRKLDNFTFCLKILGGEPGATGWGGGSQGVGSGEPEPIRTWLSCNHNRTFPPFFPLSFGCESMNKRLILW